MTPSAVRPLLERFLVDRTIDTEAFARAFLALEDAKADVIPKRLRGLAVVVEGFLDQDSDDDGLKPTPQIVAGVAREALEDMPLDDEPPQLEAVLDQLRRVRGSVEASCGYQVEGVFGSVARGDADAFSDVDVMVRPIEATDLGRLFRAEQQLTKALGRKAELFDRTMYFGAEAADVTRDLVRL
jgi:predicted nucleotidyltransferase